MFATVHLKTFFHVVIIQIISLVGAHPTPARTAGPFLLICHAPLVMDASLCFHSRSVLMNCFALRMLGKVCIQLPMICAIFWDCTFLMLAALH